MAKRFMNDDAVLKPNSRIAVRISEDKLREEIIKFHREVFPDDVFGDYTDEVLAEAKEFNRDPMEQMAFDIFDELLANPEDNIFDARLDCYCVIASNGVINGNDGCDEFLGFHTLPNGLTYLGAIAAGDDTEDLFIIIYHDGEKLRCYIPSCGNNVMLDLMSQFGVDVALTPELEKQYTDSGILNQAFRDTYDEYAEESWWVQAMYLSKYGIPYSHEKCNSHYCWEGIKKDLMTTFQVV